MAKKKNTVFGTILTVVIIIVVIWMRVQEARDEQRREGVLRDADVEITVPGEKGGFVGDAPRLTPVRLVSDRFDIIEGCTLIDRRGNDGDSFMVRTPGGREEFRLYFVDAPESAARTYGNGDTNHRRIAKQGVSLGGLNQHETTQVGVEAKLFVKKLLGERKFRVATSWESVYRSHRKYAFVIVHWEGEERYLHELLVARGLVRIHTKPMTLPDNTAGARHKKHLYELEKNAKKMRYGAWGVRKSKKAGK